MWKIVSNYLISTSFALVTTLTAEEAVSPPPHAVDFAELSTGTGRLFKNVSVTRVEADAILIQHEDGVARVSLFDLSPELQRKYDFDPVSALRVYQQHLVEDRERRKTMLLESLRYQAAEERAQAKRELARIARAEWLPVEATVVRSTDEGLLIRAKRIVMKPTQVRSTLGLLREGPPEKTLIPFDPPLVLLQNPLEENPSKMWISGESWKGYLNPYADRFVIDPDSGFPTIPTHRGILWTP